MENKDNIWPDPISHQQVNTVLFDRIKQKFEMLETANRFKNFIKDIIIATEFAIILLLIVF